MQESGEAPEGQQQEADVDATAGKTAWPTSPPSSSAAASAGEAATPAALEHETPQPAVGRSRGSEDAGDVEETPADPETSQTHDVAPSEAAAAAGGATPGTAAELAAAEAAAEAERAAAALETEIAAFHEVCPSCLMSCIEAFILARASVGPRNHRRAQCSWAGWWFVPRHPEPSACTECILLFLRTGSATGAVVVP